MKKWIEKIGLETFLGGLFGIITLIAILTEMSLDGFSTEACVGGIKDIFGTMITVVMLFVAIRALAPKKKAAGDFQQAFDDEMTSLTDKYNPMFSRFGIESAKDESINGSTGYNIANKLDCISTNDAGASNRLFRVKKGDPAVTFSVSKTIFGEDREAVAARIAAKIKSSYSEMVADTVLNDKGFTLNLAEPLESPDDAKGFARIVDHILLLYVAEYHKK